MAFKGLGLRKCGFVNRAVVGDISILKKHNQQHLRLPVRHLKKQGKSMRGEMGWFRGLILRVFDEKKIRATT